SPRSISPEVSPQVERVVFKALEKKPEQRYGSATELAEAFCRAVALSNTSNKGAMVGGGNSSNQKLPEVAAPGSDKLVLPPVRTTVPGASRLRPAPLSSSTETTPFVAPHLAAPPVPPPAPVQPRE